jgi:hypothetical protein
MKKNLAYNGDQVKNRFQMQKPIALISITLQTEVSGNDLI